MPSLSAVGRSHLGLWCGRYGILTGVIFSKEHLVASEKPPFSVMGQKYAGGTGGCSLLASTFDFVDGARVTVEGAADNVLRSSMVEIRELGV